MGATTFAGLVKSDHASLETIALYMSKAILRAKGGIKMNYKEVKERLMYCDEHTWCEMKDCDNDCEKCAEAFGKVKELLEREIENEG